MLTNLEGARIFSNGRIIDTNVGYMTTNWANRRYGEGFGVNDPRGVGHMGVIGEISQEVLNGRIDAGTMPPGAQAVLDHFGLTGLIEDLDWNDLHFLRSNNGYSAMRVILDSIRAESSAPPPPEPAPPPIADYPDAPPLTGPDSVYERIKLYGLIYGPTPYEGLLGQKWYATRYYQNKLVPNVNEQAWMLEHHGLRPLQEVWVPTEDGIYLYDQLELRNAEWGLSLAENHGDGAVRQEATKRAYWEWERAFVPATDQGVQPQFGDRVVNPRAVLNTGRRFENAIAQGLPHAAAWCGPRIAMTLGQPQHFSRYEAWGMSSQPLQSRDWRGVLGIGWAEGDGDGTFPGGPA